MLPAAVGSKSIAAFGQAVDQAAAQMDAVGIAKAIVFPPPPVRSCSTIRPDEKSAVEAALPPRGIRGARSFSNAWCSRVDPATGVKLTRAFAAEFALARKRQYPTGYGVPEWRCAEGQLQHLEGRKKPYRKLGGSTSTSSRILPLGFGATDTRYPNLLPSRHRHNCHSLRNDQWRRFMLYTLTAQVG